MDAFAMGEYGAYVWSSFALTFTVVLIAALQSRHRHHKMLRDVRIRLAAMEKSQ